MPALPRGGCLFSRRPAATAAPAPGGSLAAILAATLAGPLAGALAVPAGASACAAAAPSGVAVPAGPVLPHAGSPIDCALVLSGLDGEGRTTFQAVAYSMEEPGRLLVSGTGWGRDGRERLVVRPDDGRIAGNGPAAGYAVTGALRYAPGPDLAILSAPGLPACRAGGPPAAAAEATSAGSPPIGGFHGADAAEGTRLVGLRPRDGYRPRVFRATVERLIRVPGIPSLMLLRLPDGAGAESGFILDGLLRPLGSILPPPPGGDRSLICAVPIDPAFLAAPDAALDVPPGEFPAPPPGPSGAGPAADTPAGLLSRALLLTRDDQAATAIRLLDRLLEINGPDARILVERGSRSFRVGRTAAAIEDFQRAAKLDPSFHLAHFNLGVTLGSEGRYREAAAALTRALEIDPDHQRTRYQLALALQAAGDSERARREYTLLERLDPALARSLGQALGF